MIKEINVDKIDTNKVEEIRSTYKAIQSSKDPVKEIHLNLIDTTGDIEKSILIGEIFNTDRTIIPVTNASGSLDTSGTVLFALGCPGRRMAKPDAQFIINEGSPYTAESKSDDLEGSDAIVNKVLVDMGGSKTKILDLIKSGAKFSAATARKIGIVDEILCFTSIFALVKKSPGRTKTKRSDSTGSIENADSGKKGKLSSRISEPEEREIPDVNQSKASLKGKAANAGLPLKGKKTN